MSPIHPLAAAHALARWTRHDAHRFLRSDWRSHVRKDSDLEALYEEIERKYRPDQPRVSAGVREGGQWTAEAANGGIDATQSRQVLDLSAATKKGGHHFVSKAVYENLPLQPETRKVFSDATTGPLKDPTSNRYDSAHRAYNDAVDRELKSFLKESNTSPEEMTPGQAHEFLDRIMKSPTPEIETLNKRIYMREIMRMLRRPRAGE